MNATFTQFLSPKFGLFAGKVFTLDGFKGEFTGDIRNQFMNTALAFPMAGDLIVLSGYGGGVVALPWEGVILSAMALDADGTPTNSDISEAFRTARRSSPAARWPSSHSGSSVTRTWVATGATRPASR